MPAPSTGVDEAAVRLLCVSYSGVGASSFNAWPQRLGPVEIVRVQPPGRENRISEPHYGTFEDFAAGLIEELQPVADRPFALLGHCSGALAAYETAVQLQRSGLPGPQLLVVSSQVAPQDGPYGRFLGMDDLQLREEVIASTRRRGVRPNPGVVDLSVEVLRADVEANRSYRRPAPELLVGTPVLALGWAEDAEIEPWRMSGWRECATDMRRAHLPGGHDSIFEAPDSLMALLSAGLSAPRRAETPAGRPPLSEG